MYSPHTDMLDITWSGFDDPESGIDSYEIALEIATSCSSAEVNERTYVSDYQLVPPETHNFIIILITVLWSLNNFIK